MDRAQKITRHLLWLLPLLCWGIVRFGFGFDGLYGQDAYEYLRYTKSIRHAITDGMDAGAFFWPVNYPLLAALLDFVIRNISFSLQLLSCLSLITTGLFIQRSIQQKTSRPFLPGLFVVLSITMSAWMLRASTLVMSDVLAVAFFSMGIFYGLKSRSTLQKRHLVLAAVTLSLAVFTRYGYALLILPFCWLLLLELLKKRRVYSILYFLLGLILGAIPNLVLKSNYRFGLAEHHFLADWNFVNMFRSSFESANGVLHYSMPNIIHVTSWLWHPGFCWWILLALAVTPSLFRSRFNRVMLSSIFLYALFLAGTPEQNLRYLMPLLPLTVLLTYPGFEKLVRYLDRIKRSKLILIVLLIIQLALAARAYRTPFHLNRLERKIFQTMETMEPTDVYTFGMQQALIGLDSRHEVYSLYDQLYETYSPHSLILFNPRQFQAQWKDSHVMQNWNHLQAQIMTDTVTLFDDGWILVRVP